MFFLFFLSLDFRTLRNRAKNEPYNCVVVIRIVIFQLSLCIKWKRRNHGKNYLNSPQIEMRIKRISQIKLINKIDQMFTIRMNNCRKVGDSRIPVNLMTTPHEIQGFSELQIYT